jgi:cell division protein FtsL
MTDWADGIELRNYGIKCVIDLGVLSELVRNTICLAMIAGALLFYSWVRSQILSTGYESQRLFAEEESLLRTQKKLKLEEESWRTPARIDNIARNELGMTLLRPNQLILPRIQDAEFGMPNTVAMAASEAKDLKKDTDNKRFGNYPTN